MKFITKYWKRFPFVLILALFWALLKAFGISTALSGPVGFLLVLGSVVVLAAEFFRSGDIGLKTFGMDMAYSVVQLVVCTAIVTILITNRAPISASDVLLCFVVLLDAWFSPFNSFRTALRNWAAQSAAPLSPGDS